MSDGEFHARLQRKIPHLRAFAHSLCRERPVADDLCQQTLKEAWKHRGEFQIGMNMRAWLFRLLRDSFYLRFPEGVVSIDDALLDDSAHNTESIDVVASLYGLPIEQREALVLTALSGLSYQEAATIMGCPLGTIKSRVSRAREVLSKRLHSIGFETGQLKAVLNSSQQQRLSANEA